MSWAKYCIISEISRTAPVAGNLDDNPHVSTQAVTSTFSVLSQINRPKLYVPVVTFPINIEFLKNSRQGFKSKIS